MEGRSSGILSVMGIYRQLLEQPAFPFVPTTMGDDSSDAVGDRPVKRCGDEQLVEALAAPASRTEECVPSRVNTAPGSGTPSQDGGGDRKREECQSAWEALVSDPAK